MMFTELSTEFEDRILFKIAFIWEKIYIFQCRYNLLLQIKT
ncbi:hypothetical protein Loa_01850 [Legionella oakridgensis ATCC 33761 = DSM 21215]|uniref:Uncharacterized protein n=1 Tax=Legionella oakridgensis ATCC 33761 = DSM 21215 TaxID=1268635 RepID=W0BFK0_9GAMM|nr:hypothetical protein Loa_01850 [Legionella oakridgensis ATCC 33761 = DSM 21215]ETO92934.1 hypothetical protein LOR_44c06610 [Legionella oakridgensis RV-2-2007]STY20454.1 Uncharacterised protein [Legionella longbeachae]